MAEHLATEGAAVTPLELPATFDPIWTTALTLCLVEAGAVSAALADQDAPRVSPATLDLVARWRAVPAAECAHVRDAQRAMIFAFADTMASFDVILPAPALGEAPAGLDDTGDAACRTRFSLPGAPAITLPAGAGAHGLPLGIQLARAWNQGRRLLEVAAWVERALAWPRPFPLTCTPPTRLLPGVTARQDGRTRVGVRDAPGWRRAPASAARASVRGAQRPPPGGTGLDATPLAAAFEGTARCLRVSMGIEREGRRGAAPARCRVDPSSTNRTSKASPMTTMISRAPLAASPGVLENRWFQLLIGLVCMMSISSPQYVWTLFTKPLSTQLGVPLSRLQITFSVLIVLQTFFSPFQGRLIDRFGARRLIGIGVVLSGLSWVLASNASSLGLLYLSYGVVGGLGTGIVYVGVVGQMVRWFPDRRGFAVGMVAAGYGMGAILTTFPISRSLASQGLQTTLWQFGIVFAVIGFLASLALRSPAVDSVPAPGTSPASRTTDLAPAQMLRTPLFWLMFGMMTMMSTSGLMVTSQMASFSRDFGVADVMVLGLAALPLALTIDRLTNGLTRPFFGWISDRFGRENTMFFAFLLEGIAMALWLTLRGDAVWFVLLSGVVFFGWGEIFSLFPSTLTDTFGTRHATSNYGWLYISQGIGSILGGPLAALMHEQTGSWQPVFASAITLDIVTALLALFVLKPWRRRYLGAVPSGASR